MHKTLRYLIVVLWLAIIVLPVAVWHQRLPGGFGFFTDPNVYGQDIVYAVLRLTALLAFSLLFIGIITQTFKKFWWRFFKPARLQKFHEWSGRVAFTLAISHPILLAAAGFFSASKVFIPQILSEYAYERTMALGTLGLYALIISVGAAVLRKRLARLWRGLHMMNYLVFYLILLHGLRLGSELQSGMLRYVWLVYALIVIVGQAYRVREGFKKSRPADTISSINQ